MLVERADNPIGAIVSFSSYEGNPDFRRSMAALPYDRYFIQDTKHGWFQAGCQDTGSFDGLVCFLRELKNSDKYSRLVFVGSSMGAYGALIFGNIIQADTVLAFDPQTFIDAATRARYGDRRWASDFAKIQVRVPHVREIINPATRNLVVFGEDTVIDAVHAFQLWDIPNVDLTGIGFSAHNSAQEISRAGDLSAFIAGVASGSVSRGNGLPPLFDFGTWTERCEDEAVRDLWDRRLLKEDTTELTARLSERLSDWGFIQVARAMDLHKEGKAQEAFQRLAKAVLRKPLYGEGQLQLGNLLMRQGLHREAASHLRIASDKFPRRAAAHYAYGLCLKALGDRDHARELFAKALKISPDWGAAQRELAEAV